MNHQKRLGGGQGLYADCDEKPGIVGESDAVKEFLLNKEHMAMYETGSPQSLADSMILYKSLIDYKQLSEKIAETPTNFISRNSCQKRLSSDL